MGAVTVGSDKTAVYSALLTFTFCSGLVTLVVPKRFPQMIQQSGFTHTLMEVLQSNFHFVIFYSNLESRIRFHLPASDRNRFCRYSIPFFLSPLNLFSLISTLRDLIGKTKEP